MLCLRLPLIHAGFDAPGSPGSALPLCKGLGLLCEEGWFPLGGGQAISPITWGSLLLPPRCPFQPS